MIAIYFSVQHLLDPLLQGQNGNISKSNDDLSDNSNLKVGQFKVVFYSFVTECYIM